jgi:integrase
MGLTAKQIEAARPGAGPERVSDGNGLYLRVYKSGRKAFQVRLDEDGKTRWVTLGTFPDMPLKEARRAAALARAGEEPGQDRFPDSLESPVASSSSAPHAGDVPDMPTLLEFARVWFDRKKVGLSSGKHVHQNWQTLRDFVFPDLGDMRLDQIRQRDIVRTLDPVWREKHETARRTLGRVNEIYELAKVQELVEVNPADFSLKAAFGPYRRQHKHHAALPFEQVPAFWVWLQSAPCDEMTRQITMLLLLTAKRTKEARFARWSDFDPDRTTWVTSQERMKMRRPHRVPLVRQTRVIIDNLDLIRATGTDCVFGKPRTKGGVISENAALNLVQKFDPDITMHGFRSSFRTWARKQGRYGYDIMELALAHEKDALTAAYERDDLLEERRPMMQSWADFVTAGDDPISLRARLGKKSE